MDTPTEAVKSSGELLIEIAQLTARLEVADKIISSTKTAETSPWFTVWSERGWSALTYLSQNKAAMVAGLALAGVIYHPAMPGAVPLDTVAVERQVDDAVAQHNANIDQKVNKADRKSTRLKSSH